MRARATSAHTVMLAHPWAPMLVVSRSNVGPNMLRYIDATLGSLREAGLSRAETVRAWNAMDIPIYGFTLQLQHDPVDPRNTPQPRQATCRCSRRHIPVHARTHRARGRWLARWNA